VRCVLKAAFARLLVITLLLMLLIMLLKLLLLLLQQQLGTRQLRHRLLHRILALHDVRLPLKLQQS